MTDTKYTHGGKRPGCGRKPRYDEETTTIAFRVPVSVKERMAAENRDWSGEFVAWLQSQPKEE